MSVNVKITEGRHLLGIMRKNLNATKGKLITLGNEMEAARNIADGEFRSRAIQYKHAASAAMDEVRYGHNEFINEWVDKLPEYCLMQPCTGEELFTFEVDERFGDAKGNATCKYFTVTLAPSPEMPTYLDYMKAKRIYHNVDAHRASLETQIAKVEKALALNNSIVVETFVLTDKAMDTINRAVTELRT